MTVIDTTPIFTHHHRNGVCGRPFSVCASLYGLHLHWDAEHPPTPYIDTVVDDWDVTIPWERIRANMQAPARTDGLRVAWVEGTWTPCFTFDARSDQRDSSSPMRTFLAVYDVQHDVATAVFDTAILPELAFGRNSWRGDHYHDRVAEWARTEV
jgi:hypothetical protein